MNSKEFTPDPRVCLTEDGYFTLKNIPSNSELKQYYEEKYFQSGEQYSLQYSQEEICYLKKRVRLKLHALKKHADFQASSSSNALEIGVGEGWTLNALQEIGLQVTGVDFSDFAISKLNPHLLPHFRAGNVNETLDQLIKENKKFELIWLDNVLEHSPDPKSLLEKCLQLSQPKTVLVAEVPNDFSPVQLHLLEQKKIDKSFWVVPPDHISYFNKKGLSSLCSKLGWKPKFFFSDFPIELFLFNENTNYQKKRDVGKSCHNARVAIEGLLIDQGQDKALDVFSSLAEAGFGRQIIGIFRRE
jgi:2-polyprenyl-3-methyl-5-hydroxy-6-metoxy-1,4-benzoquinol methylase